MIQNERSWETHIPTVWIFEIQKRFTQLPLRSDKPSKTFTISAVRHDRCANFVRLKMQ